MTKLYQGPTGLFFPADNPWAGGANRYHLYFNLKLPNLTLQGSGQKIKDIVLSDLEKWVDQVEINQIFGGSTAHFSVSAPEYSFASTFLRKIGRKKAEKRSFPDIVMAVERGRLETVNFAFTAQEHTLLFPKGWLTTAYGNNAEPDGVRRYYLLVQTPGDYLEISPSTSYNLGEVVQIKIEH